MALPSVCQTVGWSSAEDIKQVEALLRYAPKVLTKWRQAITASKHIHHVSDDYNVIIRKPKQGNSLGYTLDRCRDLRMITLQTGGYAFC